MLPTKDINKPIEERLFEITLFLSVVTFLIWSVVGIVSGYTWIIQGVYFFAVLFYSVLYVAVKRGLSFSAISAIYYITALLLIAFAWLPSGGIKGAIMHMCVLVYLSGLMVLPLRWYLAFMFITLCVVLVFILVEHYHPHLAVPYTHEEHKFRDLSIAGLLMLSLMGIAFYIFKKEYLNDRKSLEYSNNELVKEKVRAEASDRAKTRFLTTISHSMRTPLNGIVGLTELLSGTNLSTEQRELVEHLAVSSKNLRDIVSDVLDISAIENDKVVLQFSEFDAKAIFADIPELFKVPLLEKKGQVRLEIAGVPREPLQLLGDLSKIRQIVVNLVSNAVRFTEKGTVSLKLEVTRTENARAMVMITVEDTGWGIPDRFREDIFRRYFVIEEKNKAKGAGLGLFIAKSIVEMMGGKIWFSSVQGVGSSFYVKLPLQIGKTPQQKEDSNKEQPIDFSSLRVLVAEDVHINRIVVLKILKSIGVTKIEVAEDGLQAVDKASQTIFDLILMDVQMPNMDGIEAAMKIKRIFAERGDRPPVIVAVTANAMKEDEEACKQAGMADFITKPFSAKTLAEVIRKQHIATA